MTADAGLFQNQAIKRLARPAAWKRALLAGFVTQLLLILFVTAIGLRQLGVTTNSLKQVVDVHMRKQNLTKSMVVSARERTMILVLLYRIEDPIRQDELRMQFSQNAADFSAARRTLLSLPLNTRERELIDLQGQLTRLAIPIQLEVIDLINLGFHEDAASLTVDQAIPTQNKVMEALWQLDAETQRVALAASDQARAEHRVARFWMFLLSLLALLIGVFVAAVVFSFTNRISRERETLATHDTLTGLPNRMLFMDRLEQSLIRANRHKTLIGLMFIDLDRFKRVNDTLGHDSGDQLICEVARRLRESARAEDVVARLGGDEFVLVVNDAVQLKHILQVVENVLAAVARPCLIAGRELFCSCSIGISVYPNDGETSSDLLKHADTAMYHAKHNGRNCFHLYDSDMNSMAEERLLLETDLHYALERNEFAFHYQPQINLETGRIHGLEALIRWNHPSRGLLSPAAFLGMLEETGEVINVGRTLMKEACHQSAIWHAAGFTDLHIAVNLSGKEFWHEDLIPGIQEALTQSGLPAHALQLELTEGILMDDMDAAARRIHELKSLGLSVAIDDFGTGYSSLAHLKRFPLDVLKIDRFFVKDIQDSPANEALVSSILALCKGLDLGTVAEGVETRAQLETLRALGCPNVQGYFISRPVPAGQVAGLLERDWLRGFNATQPDQSAITLSSHAAVPGLQNAAVSAEQ